MHTSFDTLFLCNHQWRHNPVFDQTKNKFNLLCSMLLFIIVFNHKDHAPQASKISLTCFCANISCKHLWNQDSFHLLMNCIIQPKILCCFFNYLFFFSILFNKWNKPLFKMYLVILWHLFMLSVTTYCLKGIWWFLWHFLMTSANVS